MFVPLVHSPGHAQADFGEAMAVIGGVPRSILYDNTKLAVARILGDGKRQRTRVFTELQSHYLFEDRFGRPVRQFEHSEQSQWDVQLRRDLLPSSI